MLAQPMARAAGRVVHRKGGVMEPKKDDGYALLQHSTHRRGAARGLALARAAACCAAVACAGHADPRGGSPLATSSAALVSTDGGESGAEAPSAGISASPINFGLTDCGSSTPQSLTLQNAGTADLTVSAAAQGWFSVSPTSATIAPGGSQTLTVTATVPTSATASAVRP